MTSKECCENVAMKNVMCERSRVCFIFVIDVNDVELRCILERTDK